jgi:hypothetical protein
MYKRSNFLLDEPKLKLTSPLLLVVPPLPTLFAKSVKAATEAFATGFPSFLDTTFKVIFAATAAFAIVGADRGVGLGAIAG